MSGIHDFDDMLMAAAREAMKYAHAPYSGLAVGAAIRLTDGGIVTGTNLENASYGLSLCAETVAVANANNAGRIAEIEAIAVVGGAMDGQQTRPRHPVTHLTPCGRCRQVLAEAARLAGRDIRVYCADIEGGNRTVYSVSELLPHAFSSADFAARTQ